MYRPFLTACDSPAAAAISGEETPANQADAAAGEAAAAGEDGVGDDDESAYRRSGRKRKAKPSVDATDERPQHATGPKKTRS